MNDEEPDEQHPTEPEQANVNLRKPPARIVVQVHGWYPILALVLVFVVVSGLNILYTNYVNHQRQEADQRAAAAARAASRAGTCQLVVAFDELYKETPPATPAGQNVARLWAEYRRALAC
jgi:hypothetical protein